MVDGCWWVVPAASASKTSDKTSKVSLSFFFSSSFLFTGLRLGDRRPGERRFDLRRLRLRLRRFWRLRLRSRRPRRLRLRRRRLLPWGCPERPWNPEKMVSNAPNIVLLPHLEGLGSCHKVCIGSCHWVDASENKRNTYFFRTCSGMTILTF